MPFINLIEEQRIAEKREQAQSRTALMVLSSVCALGAVGCGFMWLAIEGLDSEAAALQKEADKVRPLQEQISDVQSLIGAMGPKFNTLENAQKLTGKWDVVLNHLTTQTPREIWLTNIRTQASDPTKPIEVSFIGMGQQLQTIGEYMLRLQTCEMLQSVGLKFTQEKMVSERTGIEFEITSQLAGSAEEEKVADESKEASK